MSHGRPLGSRGYLYRWKTGESHTCWHRWSRSDHAPEQLAKLSPPALDLFVGSYTTVNER